MQGVPRQFEFTHDQAQFFHPRARAGIELYRAHIVQHAFEPHTHAAYGFGTVACGVERFRYLGSEHLAGPGSIVTMNPDILHTGRAETDSGWQYHMIYIEPQVLDEIAGAGGWWFGQAVQHDPARALRLAQQLAALWQEDDALAFDCQLAQLVSTLAPLASTRRAPQAGQRFDRVIDYMHAHLAQRLNLDTLAAVAGLSPFHFLRQFQAQYHATPQQMLMALRLYRAKQLLTQGTPPAQVAADCGLADQAHLNRSFLKRYGTTPARYQKAIRG
jgi:AraC-like DNA-binding protein